MILGRYLTFSGLALAAACAQPATDATLRGRVAACLEGESIFGKKRWPADREMKVLIGGVDAEQRLLRRSLLKPELETMMRELGQPWSYTEDLEDADAYFVLAQNGKPASEFSKRILSALYDGDQTKVADALPDIEQWSGATNLRMNMNTEVSFSVELTQEGAASGEAPVVNIPDIFSTARRLVILRTKHDTPNAAFARVSAFAAVIGLEAVASLSSCDSYSGLLSDGQGPSRQDRIALELIR